MEANCELCGMGWCGRPCLRDPKKSNWLLFHADGRAKTLHERGLGWDDPPLEKPVTKARRVTANKPANSPANTANKPAAAVKPANTVKEVTDRVVYMRELMRKKRATAKVGKGKPQEFRG